MSGPVRVGLVGLGIIAETHLAVLASLPRASLAFTVDLRPDPPPAFRGTMPPHYRTLTNALGDHEVDLIVIATPTPTHARLATQALTTSSAGVLVEKPLVHDLAALDQLRSLDSSVDLDNRLSVAHHFAFSPEVRWAANQIDQHPDWGPITAITSAFYDPYILRGDQAFASYVSSWMDSGINQLSMLSRFVEFLSLTSRHEADGGASAWCAADFRCRAASGTARLRTSWLTGASSKRTTLTLAHSGIEVWIDHTAMNGFVAQGHDLLATHGHNGQTPRKLAHYRPLYQTLLTGIADPALTFDTAATVTQLLHATPSP